MSITDRLSSDLSFAQKSKDETVVSTLRLIFANIKNAQIAKGHDLSEEEIIEEIVKDAKRHHESIEAFAKAGRDDLVKKEKAELSVLKKYLPEELSESELENMVAEAIKAVGANSISDLGTVIKSVMTSARARAQGAKVAQIAKRLLANDK